MSYNISKTQLRASMAADVVHEQEESLRKRRRVRESEEISGPSGPSDMELKEGSIWDEWKELLNDPCIALSWHALSPERHGVIWCSKLIRRRFFMPGSLYERTLQEIPDPTIVPVKQLCQSSYTSAIQAYTRHEKFIKNTLLSVEGQEDAEKQAEYLFDTLNIFTKTVFPLSGSTLTHSENCYKSDALWPALQAVALYLRNVGHKVIFYTGEEELVSMSRELQKEGQKDGRLKYYADGVFRINTIEVCILEASSAHGKATRMKCSFDHFKAMFGTLAIIRHIASKYKFASFTTFKKLKVHFIHAHGSAIRHWTTSVVDEGVYLMTKVDKSEVPLSLNTDEQEDNSLQHFVQLHLNLIGALEETSNVLADLKKEHHNSQSRHSLEDLVKPLIVRLTEQKHAKTLEEDGPQSP